MPAKPTIDVLLLRADQPDRATVVPIERDYRAMQAIVGGYIQSLRLNGEVAAYLDEDGKFSGRPVNPAANKVVFLANPGLADDDFVVGDAVLVGLLDADGNQDGVEHCAPPAAFDLCHRAGLEVVDQDGRPVDAMQLVTAAALDLGGRSLG